MMMPHRRLGVCLIHMMSMMPCRLGSVCCFHMMPMVPYRLGSVRHVGMRVPVVCRSRIIAACQFVMMAVMSWPRRAVRLIVTMAMVMDWSRRTVRIDVMMVTVTTYNRIRTRGICGSNMVAMMFAMTGCFSRGTSLSMAATLGSTGVTAVSG